MKKKERLPQKRSDWLNEVYPKRASRLTEAIAVLALIALMIVIALILWGVGLGV